jgi:hypothetical protein
MQFKKKTPELAPRVVDVPIEARIRGLQEELEGLVMARAQEIKNSPTGSGLPLETIVMMLRGHTGACQCATALKVIADQKKDAEIAERQRESAA